MRADEPPLAERFLLDGRLAEGITALEARLTSHPDDDHEWIPNAKQAGECTDPAFWWRLDRLFRGQFLGFAIWFN